MSLASELNGAGKAASITHGASDRSVDEKVTMPVMSIELHRAHGLQRPCGGRE